MSSILTDMISPEWSIAMQSLPAKKKAKLAFVRDLLQRHIVASILLAPADFAGFIEALKGAFQLRDAQRFKGKYIGVILAELFADHLSDLHWEAWSHSRLMNPGSVGKARPWLFAPSSEIVKAAYTDWNAQQAQKFNIGKLEPQPAIAQLMEAEDRDVADIQGTPTLSASFTEGKHCQARKSVCC